MSDYPIHLFRFHVEFRREEDDDVKIAKGAFSECTGLEATMEANRARPFSRMAQAVSSQDDSIARIRAGERVVIL